MNFLESYGPRIEKFALNPLENDFRVNILEGSVRSGKTWALHAKILYACDYPVAGWRFITGVSKDSIFTNVLNDLFAIIGPKRYHYNHQSGLLRMFETNWKVIGAKDEGSEKFLRGATIGFAVCDEIVLMPKGFFQMLLTRMSPAGARLYGSTNPDSPMHWLKTEYLDDPTLRANKILASMHVTMNDNPNLSPEYVASQKALYKGLFYERYILGRWVMAEGAIWRDAWSDDLLYDDGSTPMGLYAEGGHVDRWVSVDCGVDHPQVYLEWYDDGKIIWCSRRYCWDSRKEMRQKTDGQYADDLVKFMGENRGCQVIIPPEAASFRAELVLRGIWVTDADNDVDEGIKTVASLMTRKMVRFHLGNCAGTVKGIELYCWDPKAALRGEEKPLKVEDDDADCVRYSLRTKVPRYRYNG